MEPKRKAVDYDQTITHLVFIEGDSNKFWEISVNDSSTIVNYGKNGTKGQTITKVHTDNVTAMKFAKKQIAGKKKKGYRDANETNDINRTNKKQSKNSKPASEFTSIEMQKTKSQILKHLCNGDYYIFGGFDWESYICDQGIIFDIECCNICCSSSSVEHCNRCDIKCCSNCKSYECILCDTRRNVFTWCSVCEEAEVCYDGKFAKRMKWKQYTVTNKLRNEMMEKGCNDLDDVKNGEEICSNCVLK